MEIHWILAFATSESEKLQNRVKTLIYTQKLLKLISHSKTSYILFTLISYKSLLKTPNYNEG